jgi:hypothetical protein
VKVPPSVQGLAGRSSGHALGHALPFRDAIDLLSVRVARTPRSLVSAKGCGAGQRRECSTHFHVAAWARRGGSSMRLFGVAQQKRQNKNDVVVHACAACILTSGQWRAAEAFWRANSSVKG